MHPAETGIGAQKEVKEQLGRSTIAMTLVTYTHLFDQSRDEAASTSSTDVRRQADRSDLTLSVFGSLR
jgi:hypothetical protein